MFRNVYLPTATTTRTALTSQRNEIATRCIRTITISNFIRQSGTRNALSINQPPTSHPSSSKKKKKKKNVPATTHSTPWKERLESLFWNLERSRDKHHVDFLQKQRR